MNETSVKSADPQAIFHKTSQKEVPAWFEKELLTKFGKDEFGDPVIRVRYDGEKFREGVWIVEEKWGPQAFGSREDWEKTQVVKDEDGIIHDFGAFPSRGLYMAIMLWTDHYGSPMDLSHELIERLSFQKHMREQKDIPAAEVAAQTEAKAAQVEAQQATRWEEATKELAESLKTDADKILAATTRVTSLPTPNRILSLN